MALGLPILLAACTSVQTPAAISSVQVTGDTTLTIGQQETLSVTLKDAAGNPLTGRTVTWTSSAPDLVSVDANGRVTARHFTPNGTPNTVTITATSEGKRGTLTVTPYGFDLSCGTYVTSDDPGADVAFYARFRAENGSNIPADTNYSIVGPTAFNAGKPYNAVVFQGSSAGAAYGGAPAVAGTYSATLSVAGTTYSDSCSIDPAVRLGFVTNPVVSVSGNTASYSGTAPAGTINVFAALFMGDVSYSTTSVALSSLTFSASGGLSPAAPSGVYKGWIYARNYNNSTPMPDVVLWSGTLANTVTIP
ncbi:hypothetical protein GCM10008956_05570 [Deinococcus arenae]|uniref:BIG2 domain-containing protein n=1 Tax=Deinococcus arenae TaxID=1452751 RepID=A0A8H9GJ54_9DEIO|nr:Ig-like domain-containing protein [Deinococcus arenae]AWT35737.1 hypothetical protein DM785_09330 [Deinococcus actinosclerus]GGM32274.1 hypothetical protein GCM10008956_05570 [Deinococcus arenae]